MKRIWIRTSHVQPIALATEDNVILDRGISAVINGPSKVVWNPDEPLHPKAWVEIEDNVEVVIIKNV
jgi:hypothetical protein